MDRTPFFVASVLLGFVLQLGGPAGCGKDKDHSVPSGGAPRLCLVEPTEGLPGDPVTVHVDGGIEARFAFGGNHAATLSVTETTAQTLESPGSDCKATHVITLAIPPTCRGEVELKAFSGLTESNGLSFTCPGSSENQDEDGDGQEDSDQDGRPNAEDPDDDNDGIPDLHDSDDDGDGIVDSEEDSDDEVDDEEWVGDPPVIDRCLGVICGEYQICEQGQCRDLKCNETNGRPCEGNLRCDLTTGQCVPPPECSLADYAPTLRIEELPFEEDVWEPTIAYARLAPGKNFAKDNKAAKKGKTGRKGQKGPNRPPQFAYAHLANKQEGYIEISNLEDASAKAFLTYCQLDDQGRPIFYQDEEGEERFNFADNDFVVCGDSECPGYVAGDWQDLSESGVRVCAVKALPEGVRTSTGARFYFKFPTLTMKARLTTRCEGGEWVAQPLKRLTASTPDIEECKVRVDDIRAGAFVSARAEASTLFHLSCDGAAATRIPGDNTFTCPIRDQYTEVSCWARGHAAQERERRYCIEFPGEFEELTINTPDGEDLDDAEEYEPLEVAWFARQKYVVRPLAEGEICGAKPPPENGPSARVGIYGPRDEDDRETSVRIEPDPCRYGPLRCDGDPQSERRECEDWDMAIMGRSGLQGLTCPHVDDLDPCAFEVVVVNGEVRGCERVVGEVRSAKAKGDRGAKEGDSSKSKGKGGKAKGTRPVEQPYEGETGWFMKCRLEVLGCEGGDERDTDSQVTLGQSSGVATCPSTPGEFQVVKIGQGGGGSPVQKTQACGFERLTEPEECGAVVLGCEPYFERNSPWGAPYYSEPLSPYTSEFEVASELTIENLSHCDETTNTGDCTVEIPWRARHLKERPSIEVIFYANENPGGGFGAFEGWMTSTRGRTVYYGQTHYDGCSDDPVTNFGTSSDPDVYFDYEEGRSGWQGTEQITVGDSSNVRVIGMFRAYQITIRARGLDGRFYRMEREVAVGYHLCTAEEFSYCSYETELCYYHPEGNWNYRMPCPGYDVATADDGGCWMGYQCRFGTDIEPLEVTPMTAEEPLPDDYDGVCLPGRRY